MITRFEAYQVSSLFSGLAEMLGLSHSLCKLADKIRWQTFDDAFEPLFCKDNGRPAKPIRMVAGLLILKHVRNLSDESVVEQWRETPYYQYFCGMSQVGYTIDPAMEQVRRLYPYPIRILAGDRVYRGKWQSEDTRIEIPDLSKASDSAYQRRKKHRHFCKRAGIEPEIGHLKSDHRLGRNFYRGLFRGAINVMLAAAAFNFKRAMRALFMAIFRLLQRICEASMAVLAQTPATYCPNTAYASGFR